MDAFLNTTLPKITHNIPTDEIWNLIADIPAFMTYSIETSRVPFDGMCRVMGEMLVPDFEATIKKLQEMIY